MSAAQESIKKMSEGILLVDKPASVTSFSLVRSLRKVFNVQKIGHAGTLDPFATGLMVMLVGKKYTTQSSQFLNQDKEYLAEIHLGEATDSYDKEGKIVQQSPIIPTLEAIQSALARFQGVIEQIPPMFSAKKVQGKKLYELARQGKEIERAPVKVDVRIEFISYVYPKLHLRINCSKGTYIRSLAHDIGIDLGCFGHLTALQRLRCGDFHLKNSYKGELTPTNCASLKEHLLTNGYC